MHQTSMPSSPVHAAASHNSTQPEQAQTTGLTSSLKRVLVPEPEPTWLIQRVSTEAAHSFEALQHPLASKTKDRAKANLVNRAASSFCYKKALPSDFSKAQEHYKLSIGHLFVDTSTEEIFHIVGIFLRGINENTSRKPKGHKTPHFKFYSPTTHLFPPLRDTDYEYTPCAEIFNQGKGSYVCFSIFRRMTTIFPGHSLYSSSFFHEC